MAYRSVIVEDEPMAAAGLRGLITDINLGVSVVGYADRLLPAIQVIDREKPDILFLDIRLRDCTGFDVLQECKHQNMEIIFVTAYDNYAILAFREHAIGYLLKPVDEHELSTSIRRAITMLDNHPRREFDATKLEMLNQRFKGKLMIPDLSGVSCVPIHSVIMIVAAGAYSEIYLTDKNSIVVAKNIGYFDEELKGLGFMRSHRSYLVNMDHVDKVLTSHEGKIKMSNGMYATMSRHKKPEILMMLGLR